MNNKIIDGVDTLICDHITDPLWELLFRTVWRGYWGGKSAKECYDFIKERFEEVNDGCKCTNINGPSD